MFLRAHSFPSWFTNLVDSCRRQEVAELQDAGKSKDAANKRCLQKLEHTNKDLEDAQEKIKKMEEKNDQKDKRKDKESLG